MKIKCLKSFGMGVAMALLIAPSAFAEGDSDAFCSGRLTGTSLEAPNAGRTHFDSHNTPNSPGNLVADLSIVAGPGAKGLAPVDREYAACVSATPEAAGYEYRMEGYSWNDNLGFISYYCGGSGGTNPEVDSEPNNAVELFQCGDFPYGVTVGYDADGDGVRQLSGFAWNPAVGYIDFNPAGGFANSGVEVNNGVLSGYAYSAAGLWLNFDGVKMTFPGAEDGLDEEGDDGGRTGSDDILERCDDRGKCVGVSPDPVRPVVCTLPSALGGGNLSQFGEPGLCIEDYVVAEDSEDPFIDDAEVEDQEEEGYDIEIFLREDDDPDVAVDPDDYRIEFNWIDTVKLNQLSGSVAEEGGFRVQDLAELESPWEAGRGGVVYKPLVVDATNFEEVFEPVAGAEPGRYKLRNEKLVRSYAPTVNYSSTTGTSPLFAVNNEEFFEELVDEDGEVWTEDIEPNVLKLINVVVTNVNTGESEVLFPNGRDGLSFNFTPAVEIGTLYANDFQDSISGSRGLPVTYKVGARENGEGDFSNLDVRLHLDYSRHKQSQGCSIDDAGAFAIKFLTGLNGEDLAPEAANNVLQASRLTQLSPAIDLFSVALFGGADSEEGQICDRVSGPTLYSTISYVLDGKTISYYGNKLPRIVSEVSNEGLTVHGNIYAPRAFNPNAAQSVQEIGNVEVSGLRDAVYENVAVRLENFDLSPVRVKSGQTCVINSLPSRGAPSLSGCNRVSEVVEVNGENGTERVLTVRGADVQLDLDKVNGASNITGNWTIVVTGGNLYIEDDVWREEGAGFSLGAAVLGPFSAGCGDQGNVYLHSSVRNVQGNFYLDCSWFSYEDEAQIGVDGLYQWGDSSNLVEKLGTQFVLEGSLSSRNTIGGADSDSTGILQDGNGRVYQLPVSIADRLKIQLYDLNFLRLFRLELDTNAQGLPLDFACQRYLTVDEIIQIKELERWVATAAIFGEATAIELYGERPEDVVGENGERCDGIDTLNSVDDGGDLVVPEDPERLARGLEPDQTDPVYVFYKPAQSFVFKK